jgi:hypothetical protein
MNPTTFVRIYETSVMIVRSVAEGWEITFQSAHALLAGQLAANLQQLKQVQHWSETLAAIVDHDDHKEDFGQNVYLTDLGAPKDFTQFSFTARERLEEVRRRLDSGYRKHRWVGLLAGRHAEHLYCEAPVSKNLDALLTEERSKRAVMLEKLGSSNAALEAAYEVLQWCDRASLILCQAVLPAMNRRIEVTLLRGKRHEVWENEDKTVCVEPWPFSSMNFDVHVEVRTVQQLTFKSDQELERCLWASAVTDRKWNFRAV